MRGMDKPLGVATYQLEQLVKENIEQLDKTMTKNNKRSKTSHSFYTSFCEINFYQNPKSHPQLIDLFTPVFLFLLLFHTQNKDQK